MTCKYHSVEGLPCTLNAEHIAGFLGVSRAEAYTLMHAEDFPLIRIGKRMLVPRDKFLKWIDEQSAR